MPKALPPKINMVIPLYNEAEVFGTLVERLRSVMDATPYSVTAILIDDGSSDATESLLRELAQRDPRFIAVLLSRNFGHQLALSAGLSQVDATDAVFILDGDLQDPPELMDTFFERIEEGYDVVYAVREKRKEGWMKRSAYSLFYRLLRRISYIDFPLDSGDFSMVSRKVVDELNRMPEESRFLRGMRSWLGFRQIGVSYERSERQQGESKYTFRRLLQLALNGIFNFSEFPIKLVTYLGAFATLLSGTYLFVTLIKRFVFGTVPEGFTAILGTVILFGGIQLLAIGIIGEYILRVFFQVKQRPLFVISEVINGQDE